MLTQDVEGRFNKLEKEHRDLKLQLDNEKKELLATNATLQQSLSHSETTVHELQRENEKLLKSKEAVEIYLQQLPSVNELETVKSDAKEKQESCRRLHLQVENLNKKLIHSVEMR